MKTIRLVLICALLCVSGAARAQSTETDRITAPDSYGGGRITIERSPELQALLDGGGQQARQVRLYRVVIYSDNVQSGRERAAGAMSRFRSAFPGVPVTRSYKSPYWEVAAGYCLTQDEAIALFGQVRTLFGSATLRETVVPLAELRAARAEAGRELPTASDETGVEPPTDRP